jgi:hypothetical protein
MAAWPAITAAVAERDALQRENADLKKQLAKTGKREAANA